MGPWLKLAFQPQSTVTSRARAKPDHLGGDGGLCSKILNDNLMRNSRSEPSRHADWAPHADENDRQSGDVLGSLGLTLSAIAPPETSRSTLRLLFPLPQASPGHSIV